MSRPSGGVIVNADDLGASAAVNDSIFRLMEAGIVTSATVLANAPETDAALARLPRFPQCSFGVHLNAVEFKPLHPTPGLAPLLAEDGSFHDVIRRVPIDGALRRAVTAEWSAQIDKVRSAIPISHVDSHRHTHTIPGLLPALREAAGTHGVRRARISLNVFGRTERKPAVLLWKKALYNRALRYYGFRVPERCGSFADFLSWAPEWPWRGGVIELMTHPGHPRYAAETAILETNWKERLPEGVRFMTYHDLP